MKKKITMNKTEFIEKHCKRISSQTFERDLDNLITETKNQTKEDCAKILQEIQDITLRVDEISGDHSDITYELDANMTEIFGICDQEIRNSK